MGEVFPDARQALRRPRPTRYAFPFMSLTNASDHVFFGLEKDQSQLVFEQDTTSSVKAVCPNPDLFDHLRKNAKLYSPY